MFHGSIVALVTPFKNDKVDVEALRALVEFHIESGTHAIVVAGTTGEAGTLSFDEKRQIIHHTIEQAKERLPIIAGTASNSTKTCIALTQVAMEEGAHAVLIMTPAYIRPTQEGLYQHYSHIAEAVAIPIILYNVPARTACDLLPETVARLAKRPNIIGIKEATGQMTRLQQILRQTDHSLDVYSGDDLSAAQWLLAGAKGVISVTANVAPRDMAKLCDAGIDTDQTLCMRIHEKLMPLHQQLFTESNPIPTKWALARMGLIGPDLRLPLTPLSEAHHQSLEDTLIHLNLLPEAP
ncbi:MAG: 4-hydroxy-tetrahydrodipicolinate synthase [Legionellaceae bacterium]|nr:4-hydroxy-tetrahydrodipicolinate synthase [Legionellaceae bacterium]